MHLQSAKVTQVREGLATPGRVAVFTPAQVVVPTQVLVAAHTPAQAEEPIQVPAAVRIPAPVVVPTLAQGALATLVLVARLTTNGTARLRIVSSVQ